MKYSLLNVVGQLLLGDTKAIEQQMYEDGDPHPVSVLQPTGSSDSEDSQLESEDPHLAEILKFLSARA